MDEMIYFDNAATTYPKPKSVLRAVSDAMLYYGANPGRGGHTMAYTSAERIFETRQNISDYFHLDAPEAVIFTKNCTEALNIVIKGLAKKGGHFVCSSLEHNAVVRPLEALNSCDICTWTVADIGDTKEETVSNFEKAINEKTIAIICTAASNVFGIRTPIPEISKLAHEKKFDFDCRCSTRCGNCTNRHEDTRD